jgi:hypothetical protein
MAGRETEDGDIRKAIDAGHLNALVQAAPARAAVTQAVDFLKNVLASKLNTSPS